MEANEAEVSLDSKEAKEAAAGVPLIRPVLSLSVLFEQGQRTTYLFIPDNERVV